MNGLLVIGFDGSPDAEHAIDVAGRVASARSAVVVTAWHPSLGAADAAPLGGVPTAPSPADEHALERSCREIARTGVDRARSAGLDAQECVARASGVDAIAAILLDVAEERDAELVVVGRRGMSRLKSAILGSVSDAAVRDGRRPVLVVPAPEDD
jgi:nucleotide-binding universal stress UspA family protein